MPVNTVYALGASQLSISGGLDLADGTNGAGNHLIGEVITLDNYNWESIDITDGDPNFADNDGSQRLSGGQSFDGVSYGNRTRIEAEYSIQVEDPDGNVYTFVGFNFVSGGGAQFATVEGLAFVEGPSGFPPPGVPLTVVSADTTPSIPFTDLDTPPCFTRGCMIETPSGPVLVQDIKVGDWVTTVDNGPQQITWVGSRRLPQAVLDRHINFKPILIKRDAMGAGCPDRDMHLSPQHRVLVSDWRAELFFGEAELLVPVTKLRNDHSILTDHKSGGVEYFHIMCSNHEIIMANGLPSESFLPSAGKTDAFETANELDALFPDISVQRDVQITVRPCVSDKRTHVFSETMEMR